MLGVDVGLIGGTGIGDRLTALGGSPLHVPTPHGTAKGTIVEVGGAKVFVLRRHSFGHKVPPHHVPYLAMADALRRLGAKACFSTAAVGSLHKDWGAGTMAVCTDILDLSGRNQTMFENGVRHTDFSDPLPAHKHLLAAAKGAKSPCVYVCMDGPRYETPFEIERMQKMGGDVVGMTAATEAIAMHEAGVPYGCLAIVTNLGAGLTDETLDHSEVGDAMKHFGDKAVEVLLTAVKESLRS